MSERPLIVVTGATGAQGGSVVNFLLNDGGFRVKGLTRNVDSPRAKELSAKGVEIVEANFDDVVSLTDAFRGAYGVFGVTNFWEGVSAHKEIKQGKTLVIAAKAAGVQHFVWSTLDRSDEDLHVAHWDSKAQVDDYLKASGLSRTSIYTSFYFENFINIPLFASYEKGDGDDVNIHWPIVLTDGPIWGYSVADTGAYVLAAFKEPDQWINKDIRIMTEIFTPPDFISALSEATGRKIVLKRTDRAEFDAAKQLPNLEELWSNMEWFYTHDGHKNRDAILTREIYPKCKRLADFVKDNKDKFPLP